MPPRAEFRRNRWCGGGSIVRGARGPSESTEQALLVHWLLSRGIKHFAVPNGAILGGRNRYGAIAKLKREGLLPGAPDIVLIDRAPDTGDPVAIEMKRSIGSRLSPNQRHVIAFMRLAGWRVVVGYGFTNAMQQLQALGY